MDSKKNLAELVTELSKNKPDHNQIKMLCQTTGYTYSTDLIQLMSDILMNFKNPNLNQKSKNTKPNTSEPNGL